MGQVRAVLRQPEIVVGTWRAALAEAPDLTEAEVWDALGRLDPLWDELFPVEQERIVRLLVERVVVSEAGAEIRPKLDGIAGLTTVTVVVPLKIRQWGGRKAIIAPDGAALTSEEVQSGVVSTRGDPALVKARARAHRWRRMLEAGEHGTVRELAKAEKVNETDITRALRWSGSIGDRPSPPP